ncbi:MAG: hypothetical protein ACRD7E_16665, partial [Bryobacteraceae bacterium]
SNQPDVVSNLGFGSRFSAAQTILGQNHALSHTATISPRFLNEFRFSYVRRNLDFPENDPTSPTAQILGFFTVGGTAAFPQSRIQNTFQWQNVSTAMLGRHSIKFGADIRRLRLFNRSAFDSKGTFRFNNLADFLNNDPLDFTQAVNEATFDARQLAQYYFVQDDFKVTRDLTLNLGIRYEYTDVPFGFFGAANEEIAAVGVPRPVEPDKNNWAPRLGLAYSPSATDGILGSIFGDGLTVFRGGYGVSYDILFFNILTVTASNYPRVVNVNLNRGEGIADQYPQLVPGSPDIQPLNPLNIFVNANTDMQNPTTHFYSFSMQRQFGRNYIFELGYTGSRSYHQIRQGQLNPGILTDQQAATVRETKSLTSIPSLQQRRLNPQWGSRVTIESTALANYNAGYAKFDRRFANGLIIGANYTYSALFSDNDESLGVADIVNSTPQVPQDYFNYRNDYSRSVFDRPHRFVVHYTWQIPGSFDNRFLNGLLSGWGVAGFNEWQSGQPFTVRTGVDTGGTGTPTPHRPDFNPNGIFENDPVEDNLRTFRSPIDGTGRFLTALTAGGAPLATSNAGGGNLGRNTFRGPSFSNTNVSLFKEISFTERWHVRLKADWINAFNQRNFLPPVVTMNSPNFGQNTSDPGGRTMLLSAHVRF